jgi:hypothetical protein
MLKKAEAYHLDPDELRFDLAGLSHAVPPAEHVQAKQDVVIGRSVPVGLAAITTGSGEDVLERRDRRALTPRR